MPDELALCKRLVGYSDGFHIVPSGHIVGHKPFHDLQYQYLLLFRQTVNYVCNLLLYSQHFYPPL